MKMQQREGQSSNQCDPGTQAVHVVQKVHGIGDSDDPNDRNDGVTCQRHNPLKAIAQECDHGSYHNLDDQLVLSSETEKIIKKAEREQDGHAKPDHSDVRRGSGFGSMPLNVLNNRAKVR
jgi:hypothetical protein